MNRSDNEKYNGEQTVILVCGNRGAGKSTVCTLTVGLLAGRGWLSSGILAPSHRDEDGYPWLVHAHNPESGESRVLASRVRGSRSPFRFDMETIAWSVGILGSLAISPPVHGELGIQDRKETGTCEFPFSEDKTAAFHSGLPRHAVFIDEIGPMELVERSGYLPGLHSILQSWHQRIVITTRNSLADSLMTEIRRSPCLFRNRKTINFMLGECNSGQEPDDVRENRMRSRALELAAMITD